MHIPENYLSPATCAVMGAIAVPVLIHASRQVKKSVAAEKIPLIGVAAAFSFLAMMFNVPLPGGTTGHAVCGTLIAILFGPWAAVLALSMALALQAIFFGDGGVLALGANIVNIGIICPLVGYAIYRSLMDRTKNELLSAAVGSYIGLNVAAFAAAVEFGIQPLLFADASGHALYCPYPLSVSIPAMMLGHLTIWGAVEVLFTTGILAFLRGAAPSFGIESKSDAAPQSFLPVWMLLAALVVATPLGLLAEGDAWGEWAVDDLAAQVGYVPAGFMGWEWESLMPDYSLAGLPESFSYILSAVIGVSLLVVIFRLIGMLVKPTASFE